MSNAMRKHRRQKRATVKADKPIAFIRSNAVPKAVPADCVWVDEDITPTRDTLRAAGWGKGS